MDPVEKKRRASYRDVLDAPDHQIAEVIAGELHVFTRPGGPATAVASALGDELGPPFKRGRGGPGGWLIVDEPELHLGDDIVVPDLAGWRRERLPLVPEGAFFTVTPDWVCEVLSGSTERLDRTQKLPLYASWGVSFAWLIQPQRRLLEAFRLHDGKWLLIGTYTDADRARIEPFDAIELDLSNLWADVPLPTRAHEATADYELDGP